jgi:proteasome alpha subunit
MIEEPYRWVEAVANRREYIEDQLHTGSPIVLLNFADGLLLLTASRQTQKVFEVYDRIALAALGHPADIERLRLVAIDLAHMEGFNRAVDDVALRRLVNFGMSPALKTAFEQVYGPPYIVKIILAELGDDVESDYVVKLDYDGSFVRSDIEVKEPFHVLAGSPAIEKEMLGYLVEQDGNARRGLDEAIKLALRTWAVGMELAERGAKDEEQPLQHTEVDAAKALKELLKTRHVEAGVLDRSRPATAKFRKLDEREIRPALRDL